MLDYLQEILRQTSKGQAVPISELQKPVIFILNTQGADSEDEKINSIVWKGSHWLTMVILPKNFHGLISNPSTLFNSNKDENSHDPQAYEKVFLFDSFSSHQDLPELLKTSLKFGASRIREVSGELSNLQEFPPILSSNTVFINNTSKCQAIILAVTGYSSLL